MVKKVSSEILPFLTRSHPQLAWCHFMMIELSVLLSQPTFDLFEGSHSYKPTSPPPQINMCPTTVVTPVPPLLLSSIASTISSIHDCRSNSRSNRGTPGACLCFPATNALNHLTHGDNEKNTSHVTYQNKVKVAREHIGHALWPQLGKDAAAGFLYSSTATRSTSKVRQKHSDVYPDPLTFPVIQWCNDAEEENDERGDHPDCSDQTVRSTLALTRLGGGETRREMLQRGSLVRSVALLSFILEEMNSGTTYRKRTTKQHSLKAHKKQPCYKGLFKSNRHIPARHQTPLVGLQTSHHIATGKYFL